MLIYNIHLIEHKCHIKTNFNSSSEKKIKYQAYLKSNLLNNSSRPIPIKILSLISWNLKNNISITGQSMEMVTVSIELLCFSISE